MCLVLCICEAYEPDDIVVYFKGLATKQMHQNKRTLVKNTEIQY